jgi:hypothetical protein
MLNIKYCVKLYNFNVFYYIFRVLAIYASEIIFIIIHVYCKYYKKNLVCFQTNYVCNYEINQGSFDLQI